MSENVRPVQEQMKVKTRNTEKKDPCDLLSSREAVILNTSTSLSQAHESLPFANMTLAMCSPSPTRTYQE